MFVNLWDDHFVVFLYFKYVRSGIISVSHSFSVIFGKYQICQKRQILRFLIFEILESYDFVFGAFKMCHKRYFPFFHSWSESTESFLFEIIIIGQKIMMKVLIHFII